MRRILLALMSYTICVSSICYADNLIDFYNTAQQVDPKWLAAQAAYNATIESKPQALAQLLPSISFNAKLLSNNTKYKTINSIANIPEMKNHFYSDYYTVSLTQPLFNLDKFFAYQISDFDIIGAEAQLNFDKQDLLFRTLKAYLAVSLAKEKLEAAELQKKSNLEQLELTKTSYKIGVADITELRESEARYNQAKGDVVSAQLELELQKNAAATVVGIEQFDYKPIRDDIQISLPSPADVQQWVESAEKNAPTLVVKQAMLEQANIEINRIRAEYAPTLDLVASAQKSNSDELEYQTYGFNKRNNAIGIEVNVPIFTGLSTSSKIRQASAKMVKAREDLEYSTRVAVQDTKDSYYRIVQGIDIYKDYKESIESYFRSVEANRLAYKVGVKKNIDVLIAERQLFDARIRKSESKYDLILAMLKLKVSSGTATEDDLYDINELLVNNGTM